MMMIHDLKYSFRLLTTDCRFTVLTALVMSTGIALSLFLLSFLNTAGIKALPFENGGSLIVFNSYQKGIMDYGGEINLHDYQQIRNNLTGVSEFGVYKSISLNVSDSDGARRYKAILAEPNIFQITRTKPIIGRTFSQAENLQGANPVVVISYSVWKNKFSGSEKILDKKLRINGATHRIIGVMPESYVFPFRTEIWLPMCQHATKIPRGESDSYHGIGHLSQDYSINDINQQLDVIMQRLEQQYPNSNQGISAYISYLQEAEGTRDQGKVIPLMYIVAIFILILASVNVGNLLLSRAIQRRKETAIRVALGAPRSRLISQMLWESIIICSVGGIIGLLIVAWGLEFMNSVITDFWYDSPPFWWKFGIDSFTIKIFVTFILTAIFVTGLIPAWRNSGADFNAVLRDGTRGAQGKKSGSLNRLLVISEIFLSIVVMIAAAIIMVGSYAITHTEYGVNTNNTLTADIILSDSKYDSAKRKIQFIQTLQNRLENSNEISDVIISSALPGVSSSLANIEIDGNEYTIDNKNSYPRSNSIVVTPGSLRKLDIELINGRFFNSSDKGSNKNTVIVTDSFVARYLNNQNAIGKRIRILQNSNNNNTENNWNTIIGVIKHTIQSEPSSRDRVQTPSIFRPYSQDVRSQITVALKMVSTKNEVTNTLRDVLASIDPELPAFRIETYQQIVNRNNAPTKFISGLFLLFSVAAVILAASGIYGVMSNTINQKTQEIGVKRALGARDYDITRELLLIGFKQLLWGGIPGTIVGLVLGFAMAKSFGAEGTAPFIIALVMASIITAVVMFATYIPTKRVLSLEPSDALRYQ